MFSATRKEERKASRKGEKEEKGLGASSFPATRLFLLSFSFTGTNTSSIIYHQQENDVLGSQKDTFKNVVLNVCYSVLWAFPVTQW